MPTIEEILQKLGKGETLTPEEITVLSEHTESMKKIKEDKEKLEKDLADKSKIQETLIEKDNELERIKKEKADADKIIKEKDDMIESVKNGNKTFAELEKEMLKKKANDDKAKIVENITKQNELEKQDLEKKRLEAEKELERIREENAKMNKSLKTMSLKADIQSRKITYPYLAKKLDNIAKLIDTADSLEEIEKMLNFLDITTDHEEEKTRWEEKEKAGTSAFKKTPSEEKKEDAQEKDSKTNLDKDILAWCAKKRIKPRIGALS